MSKINDGGSAFPRTAESNLTGMSLRDYFAGQALAGLNSSPSMRQIWDATDMARQSYQLADAMLAERERTA